MNPLPQALNGTPAEGRPGRALWLPLACAWVLMLCTFSVPGREGPTSAGALDPIALAKLASRLGALTLLGILLAAHRNRSRGRAVLHRLLPFGVFAAWAVTSAAWSALPAVSLGQAMSLIVLLLLAAALALGWRDMRDTELILANLSWGLFVINGVTLVAQLLAPDSLALNRGELVEGGDTGIFHPSTAAATAVLGLILLVAPALLWDWHYPRLLLLPGCVVHAAVLYFAASRTGLVMGLVLLLITLTMFLARRRSGAVVLLALGLAGAAYLAADPGLELAEGAGRRFNAYFQRGASEESLASLSGRTELWAEIWKEFVAAPLCGNGYFVTSRSGIIDVWREPHNFTAHNLLLQVLATTGLVGGALFLWALARLLITVRRGLSGRPDTAGLDRLLLLICLWNLGWGLPSEAFMGALSPESVVFFAMVGVAVGATAVVPGSSGRGQGVRDENTALPQLLPGAGR